MARAGHPLLGEHLTKAVRLWRAGMPVPEVLLWLEGALGHPVTKGEFLATLQRRGYKAVRWAPGYRATRTTAYPRIAVCTLCGEEATRFQAYRWVYEGRLQPWDGNAVCEKCILGT